MEKRELDKEFKDSKNPFRVVFVCAMWLTGFDVKCLSCLYLDKPLKAHTLMQTIARANRVSEGKSNGLIVDYIGIVKALRKALADYTVSKNSPAGIDPTVDKTELIQRIRTVIGKTDGFLAEHGFRLQELVDAQDFEKMSLAFGKGFFRPFHKLVQNILVVLAQEAIGFYKSPFNRSFVNTLALRAVTFSFFGGNDTLPDCFIIL
jgi:hsdR: type I site-specific deoxyribonuclease, HsdR family